MIEFNTNHIVKSNKDNLIEHERTLSNTNGIIKIGFVIIILWGRNISIVEPLLSIRYKTLRSMFFIA